MAKDNGTLFADPQGVDVNQKLKIPKDKLYWKAQKIQVQIERLEKFAVRHPQQFSHKDYVLLLDEFINITEQIDSGVTSNKSGMDTPVPGSSSAKKVGKGASDSVESGVSSDNPFSR